MHKTPQVPRAHLELLPRTPQHTTRGRGRAVAVAMMPCHVVMYRAPCTTHSTQRLRCCRAAQRGRSPNARIRDPRSPGLWRLASALMAAQSHWACRGGLRSKVPQPQLGGARQRPPRMRRDHRALCYTTTTKTSAAAPVRCSKLEGGGCEAAAGILKSSGLRLCSLLRSWRLRLGCVCNYRGRFRAKCVI
jgi:hypothetical protein